jgi:hypothetical protein
LVDAESARAREEGGVMRAPVLLSLPANDETHREAIREQDRIIVAQSGYLHVNGRYYAKEGDAAFWRRVEAERRVERAERRARICSWCQEPFRDDEPTVEIGAVKIHYGKAIGPFLGKYSVLVSRRLEAEARLFVLCHEFGHIALHCPDARLRLELGPPPLVEALHPQVALRSL